MRADHALQREEYMARAEAIQAEELGFIDRKFTHLGPPRDFQSVHPARAPAAVRPDGPSSRAEAHAMRVRPATAVASNAEQSATDTTCSNAHAKRTTPKGGSPKVSPAPSDGAMVQELERVELELRRQERAELEMLKAKLALSLRSKDGFDAARDKAAQPVPTPPENVPRPDHSRRLELCASLSVMLNVAALSAAIAIGAMQFIDAGTTAKPFFAPL
eukprot:1788302-Pleurochrysis_carterae.AAC.1